METPIAPRVKSPRAISAGRNAGGSWARRAPILILGAAVLLALQTVLAIVPAAGASKSQSGTRKGQPDVNPAMALVTDPARLPEKVAAMRDALLSAARSGVIEALRTPLEWNELKPEFAHGTSQASGGDPIAAWKAQSADGEGRQILAVLLEILEGPAVVLSAGKPGERYVWPAFAELDLTALTPAQEVQLYRLVSPQDVTLMRQRKVWTWYRLSIGADGTWHSFVKAD